MPGVVVSAEAAQRPASSAWQEAEEAYGPHPAPLRPAQRRAAHPGASTDVSLGGGAAPRNRHGCGQRRLTRSGAEPKRNPEPEQPPPWLVSPSGPPRLLRDGSDSSSPHWSGLAFARQACPGPRPPSGTRCVPVLGLPLPELGGTPLRLARKASSSPNSSFVSLIKVKFLEVIKPFCVILPEIQKPERKVGSSDRRQRRLRDTLGA